MKTYNRYHSLILYTAFLMGWVFTYVSPAPQVLARGTQVLAMETVAQEGQKFMQNTLPWDPDRMQIKVVYEGKSLLLPKGHLTLDYKLPGQKKRVGRVPFIGLVKVDGIIKKRLRLVANVTVAYDVFRSVRSLKRGHVIQHQDVELIRVESNKLMRNIISDESDLIGHRLIRNRHLLVVDFGERTGRDHARSPEPEVHGFRLIRIHRNETDCGRRGRGVEDRSRSFLHLQAVELGGLSGVGCERAADGVDHVAGHAGSFRDRDPRRGRR